MIQNTEAVIFDFDYTLADSSPGIIACVNYALAAMGLPQAADAEICRTIGMSLTSAYSIYAAGQQADRSAEFQALFVSRADETMVDHTTLLSGAAEMVTQLKAQGRRLGIVTTKFRYRIEAVLQRDGLAGAFDTVVGYEDVKVPKPDPEGLRLALLRLETTPNQAVYVGDSVTDAKTAQAAGVPFIAVLTGTTIASEFSDYEPETVLASVAALPNWLARAANVHQ